MGSTVLVSAFQVCDGWVGLGPCVSIVGWVGLGEEKWTAPVCSVIWPIFLSLLFRGWSQLHTNKLDELWSWMPFEKPSWNVCLIEIKKNLKVCPTCKKNLRQRYFPSCAHANRHTTD